MAHKPRVTDVEFRLVDDRFRLNLRDVLWYVFWVGSYALGAYAANDRLVTVLMVCCAGMAWPVRRWLGALTETITPEQEALMRAKLDWRKHALKAPR